MKNIRIFGLLRAINHAAHYRYLERPRGRFEPADHGGEPVFQFGDYTDKVSLAAAAGRARDYVEAR